MKKVVYTFFVTKAIHTNKDNCDRKSAEKMFKLSILYDCIKKKLSGVGFVRLESGGARFVGLRVSTCSE